MSWKETLLQRSSVRRYRSEPVPAEDLDFLLEVARRAPSDASGQMGTLLRITDPEIRKEVARLSGGQEHILQAPEFFVACADVYRLQRVLEAKGLQFGMKQRVALHFGIVDAVIQVTYLAAAAEALGYGTCFIGGIVNHMEDLARLLLLPRGVYPVVGLTLGIPAEKRPPRPKPPRDLLVHENAYRRYTEEDLRRLVESMSAGGRDWIAVLQRYFARGGRMEAREEVVARTLYLQGFG